MPQIRWGGGHTSTKQPWTEAYASKNTQILEAAVDKSCRRKMAVHPNLGRPHPASALSPTPQTNTHTDKHTHTHTHTARMHTHRHTDTHRHTHTHTQHTRAHARTHTHTRARTHTHANTHKHKHTDTHTHTHNTHNTHTTHTHTDNTHTTHTLHTHSLATVVGDLLVAIWLKRGRTLHQPRRLARWLKQWDEDPTRRRPGARAPKIARGREGAGCFLPLRNARGARLSHGQRP